MTNKPTDEIRSAVNAAVPVTDDDPFTDGPAFEDEGGDPATAPAEIDFELLGRCAAEPQNDIGNARRLSHRYGGDILHVQNTGWFAFDARRWEEDTDGRRTRPLAHRTAEMIHLEVMTIQPTAEERVLLDEGKEAAKLLDTLERGDDRRHVLAEQVKAADEILARLKARRSERRRFANASGNKGKLDGMLSELLAYVSIPIGLLDQDPFALNTESGTLRFTSLPDPECPDPDAVRLKWSVRLDPHRREDLISKIAPVVYDPEARAPLFRAFLERILPDPNVRAYVRRYFGYGLLGTSREQVFALFHGEGANGKSTLVDLVARVMGDYSTSLPIATLVGDTTKKGSEATPDLARLPGARLVRTAEPKEGMPLNEDVIKTLTSSEPVPIRRLHQDFVDVYPVFSLVISANRKPDIRGDNDGIWRRVHLVPFDIQIPPEERDKQLPDKLWAERSGVLNWLIGGALDYLTHGLAPPDVVRAATDEYRAENDIMGAFIKGALRVTRDNTDVATPGELYRAFCIYCTSQAQTAWRESTFAKRFSKAAERAGIEKAKNSIVLYRGVSIDPQFRDPSRTP